MERRGVSYSDRIQTEITSAIGAGGVMYGFGDNGPYLKHWRKLTMNSISKTSLEQNYRHVYKDESRKFLLSLFEKGTGPGGYDAYDDVYLVNVCITKGISS